MDTALTFVKIRWVFFSCVLLCLLPVMMTSCMPGELSSNKKLAEEWLNDLNRYDTNALASLYSDSAALESPNWEGKKTGIAGVKEVYGRYFAGTPDMKHELINLVLTSNTIVIEYFSGGTFSHPEPGTPDYMKGKKYRLQNSTRMDIRNGKIIKQVNYFDQVSFLKQVGFFDQK